MSTFRDEGVSESEDEDECENLSADEYKSKGNWAFREQQWEKAKDYYDKAIELDPEEPTYYANRAGCWSVMGKHELALADAMKSTDCDPHFVKGYSRQGKALFDLGRLDEAEAAYEEGIGRDRNNKACIEGLQAVRKLREPEGCFDDDSDTEETGGRLKWPSLREVGQRLWDGVTKGGRRGSRMQLYLLILGGYFIYHQLVKNRQEKQKRYEMATQGNEDDEDIVNWSMPWRRRFLDTGTTWLSVLESKVYP